ncbi:assimilatory nitrate reductase catalytic subunit NasC [Halalkalibacter urbisdiaboli]|uniref:assimilatory nitrate reductase catalytic subunit NasC n=1 Tax=Halalkalibacter urbisdiaboli TaxID=1960589 RepID=UPI000B42DC16|nr:molybdopterin oxidoreductase family protein [Halalkalibacter urbisdiaboli]
MTDLLLKYFRTKQQEVQSEKTYDTQCPYCSMQCKMQLIEQSVVTRKKYKTVGKANPTSEGRLCVKGLNAHQHAFHRERIKYPMKKVDGQFVRTTWDEAYALIKKKFKSIQKKHGNDALACYGGAQLTNEEAYLFGKFARVALKTKYIDYNGRFCMSAAATAANVAFGIDRGLTTRLTEIPNAKVIILAGTNIAECQPTIMPYFEKAKENGAYIIVIDPRQTGTTKIADLHLQVKPGTDAALVNGLLKVLLDEGYTDHEFINNRTNGFEALVEHATTIDLEKIAGKTGVSVEDIKTAATVFGKEATGMIFTARGVEQQVDGYMAVRNFLNMIMVTGKIGKPGCGYGAITGQGNGQGGREHGQKADQLPGYRSIENPEHRKYIADVWGIDEKELPRKGISAYEMMEKVHEGEIHGMLLMASNPIVSNPNASFVKEALEKLDFFVAIDMFISETAQLADLILPTSSYLENEGTFTNLEGRVTLREASKELPGEVKHDWKILSEIAELLGKGKYFSYSCAEDIFNELRIASKGGIADYYGITYERIREKNGMFWPCPSLDHDGTEIMFKESFAHPDKRGIILPVSNESEVPKKKPTQQFPLYLTTGRVVAHYLTGVLTRKSPALAARNVESHIQIHPETAQSYGIQDNDLVKIESERGTIVVRGQLSDEIRKDTVFVPFHWADSQNVNCLVPKELDPTCRMPGFKVTTVNITALRELA